MLAVTVETQRQVLEFANVPTGWWRLAALALLAAIVYGVFWMYRREGRIGASAPLRYCLAIIRSAVLVLLAIIALRPVLATYFERTTPARVAVLVDASASMDVVDAEAEQSRAARVADLLSAADFAWLRGLSEQNELAVYAFAGRPDRIAEPLAAADPNATGPEPGRTDIGAAVRQAANEAGEQPLAAVIVLSDGALNAGMAAEEIAALARRQRAALYAVGVGSPAEPPNVRIARLAAPSVVPLGDPFEVRIDVAAAGLPPGELEVTLRALPVGQGDPNAAQVLAERRIPYDGRTDPEPLRLEVDPAAAGEFMYQAVIAPLAGEASHEDNEQTAPVRIYDRQLRVLIVTGRPSYEYRYLTHLLERDTTIDVSCWLQSADERAVRDGNTIITALPREPEELLQYDVVLLLDPNPAELDAAWSSVVRRFVEELGGGLLYQAGTHYATRFLRDTRLAQLVSVLPITPDPEAAVRLSERGAFATRAAALRVTDEGQGHPLTVFDSDVRINAAIWEALPEVYRVYPVRRTKALAPPLVQRGDAGGDVVLAAQPMGAGRVAFLATESTWRWRATAEAYYNRFWVQTVRYLAYARRQSASARGAIVPESETVNVGDYLRFEVRVLDPSFVPWQAETLPARVRIGDAPETEVTLKAVAGREGWFAGRTLVNRAGLGVISVALPGAVGDNAAQETMTAYFSAQRGDTELRALAMNETALRTMTDGTGGRFLTLDEAGVLPTLIESAAETEIDAGPQRDLWDRPWVLAVLAVLLATEWTLRRRNYLL